MGGRGVEVAEVVGGWGRGRGRREGGGGPGGGGGEDINTHTS